MASPKPNKSGRWIAELFRNEIRSTTERKVGIEIERIGLWSDLSPFQYSDTQQKNQNTRFGAKSLLEQLSKKHHWPTINNSQGQALGLTTSIGKVTLEPGSQVELSTNPFSDLLTIKTKVTEFEKQVSELTDSWGLHWIGLGVNPISKVSDIELIPSTRYKIMDDFLKTRGTLGTSMMRRTSSVQINLDYTSEQEAIEMLRVALLVTPISYALFANSPFCEGKPTGYQSYRARIWQNTDPSRTGLLPEVFQEGFSFDDYAHYLWNEPLMFVQDAKNNYLPGKGLSLTQIEQNQLPGIICSENNQLNSIRELFSEARIKLGYVEIRSIDGLLPDYRYAASAFWLGILYSKTARAEVFKLLGDLTPQERQELFDQAIQFGLNGKFKTLRLGKIATELLELAESELQARGFGEAALLDPVKHNLKFQQNPASILLDKFNIEWNSDITKVIEYTRQQS